MVESRLRVSETDEIRRQRINRRVHQSIHIFISRIKGLDWLVHTILSILWTVSTVCYVLHLDPCCSDVLLPLLS